MTNHIHLLIETEDVPLKNIMQYLNRRYAIYFNKRYDYYGHVFQGRYGANLIDNPEYFLRASRYIHRNPVEAKITLYPSEYKWSSYYFYHNSRARKSPVVTTEKILSYFPYPQKANYSRFVEE